MFVDPRYHAKPLWAIEVQTGTANLISLKDVARQAHEFSRAKHCSHGHFHGTYSLFTLADVQGTERPTGTNFRQLIWFFPFGYSKGHQLSPSDPLYLNTGKTIFQRRGTPCQCHLPRRRQWRRNAVGVREMSPRSNRLSCQWDM